MRPVNLIPVEERRGAARGPAGSTGSGVYIVLGVMGVALVGVLLLVLQGNKVNDQKSELAKIEAETEEAQQQAKGTGISDASFEQTAQARFDLVHQTAADRFRFERRLRQLTRAMPNGVKLTALKASLKGDESSGGSSEGASGGTSGEAAGAAAQAEQPSINLELCIPKGDPWQQLTETATRIRNLDGVEKVTVEKSEIPDSDGGGGATAEATSPCLASDFKGGIAIKFKGKSTSGSGTASGDAPRTAVQQAQGAGATSDTANEAAGADGTTEPSDSAPAGDTP